MLSAATLLKRLDALRAATDEASRAAVVKLESRGATAAVLDDLRAMLEKVTTVADAPVAPAPTAQELSAREADAEAMWAYYLEWSAIARVAIKDRAVLRALGFGSARRKATEEEETEEADPATTGVIAGGAPI